MELKELKKQIENRTIDDSSIIFEIVDDFVARQYIHEIAKIKGLMIESRDSLDGLLGRSRSFDMSEKVAYVVSLDSIDELSDRILSKENIYIITKKIDKNVKENLASIIVTIPKLESWQIRDYVYSVGDGVKREKLDWLIHACNDDIHRLDQELQKITLFSKESRNSIFDDIASDGLFSDATQHTMFDLSNALCTKDIDKLRDIYADIYQLGINEFGFLAILINSFRNIVSVQMSKNPERELTHLTSKQLYAIRKNCGHYKNEQLTNILLFLYSLDSMIKSRELDIQYFFDYVFEKILTM